MDQQRALLSNRVARASLNLPALKALTTRPAGCTLRPQHCAGLALRTRRAAPARRAVKVCSSLGAVCSSRLTRMQATASLEVLQVASMGQEIAEVATTCFIITLVVRVPCFSYKVLPPKPAAHAGTCHRLRAAARGGGCRGRRRVKLI